MRADTSGNSRRSAGSTAAQAVSIGSRFVAGLLAVGVVTSSPVRAGGTGTIEGTTTTLGGLPLNGMCGVLYDATAQTELIDFAPTGTDGTAGHYTQANIPDGRYVLFFINCGANTDGNPDVNYVPIFFGSTWDAGQATKVVVTSNQTTTLGAQAIPLGGTVIGRVRDRTLHMGADSPPVMMVPPGGAKFFLRFSWTLVCAKAKGKYSSATSFMQGVPDSATVYFAPGGWGCTNSQGVFNAGEFLQSKSKPVSITPDGTISVNGGVKEAVH